MIHTSSRRRRLLLALAMAVTIPAVGGRATAIRATSVPPLVPLVSASVLREFARPSGIPYPDDNRHSEARYRLGRMLFYDPRLSGNRTVACATCHNPGLAWGDGLGRAHGNSGKPLRRRTPTLLNLAWAPVLFWDGRAGSLEEQALAPFGAAEEMNLPTDQMVRRLDSIDGYRLAFDAAYPGERLTPLTVAKALATFERGIVSASAPFDRWMDGDAAAMPPAAVRGFSLFTGKARCDKCHSGWRFTDDSFHDIGIETTDHGRGPLMPGFDELQYAFKTPTLRNVAQRAPYYHNGSGQSLAEVIDLYDKGGLARRPSLSPDITPLGLTTQDRGDLVAFLHALTSDDIEARVPALPH